MIIKRSVYDSILECCPKSPVEAGGILGKRNGVVITHFLDNGKGKYGMYAPDINMLNSKIEQWNKNSIVFCGVYHSHYPDNEHLSSADIEYIKSICSSNKDIKNLFFPIVVPEKKIVVYKSTVTNGKISIKSDRLFIIR